MQLNITRIIAAGSGGMICSVFQPTLPLAAICTGMVVADVYTAWMLSRRVARLKPESAKTGAGKLQSNRLGKALITLGKIYALLIMATAIDHSILNNTDLQLSRFCAGAVCFWQAISVLENESSCSDAAWARIARRWLIDKARRHFQ
jgi:hypothetical protein